MILLLQYMAIYTAVLMLVALGGCFSEHSGVINIGLEGIMVFGALGGALVMRYLPDGTSAVFVVLLCVLAAMAAGLLYSLLLAVAAINFKADQTLVGTAMNLLGTAAATVLVKAVNQAADAGNVSATIAYGSKRPAFLIFSNLNVTDESPEILRALKTSEFSWLHVLALVLLVVSYLLLYRTKFGLRMRSCGEHPQASASVGINVFRMRYAGVMISGVLGGLGGLTYITAAVSEWKFENGVAGFGFLALAVMIFGRWKPFWILLAAVIFGFFRSLSNVYMGFDFLQNLLPSQVYTMLPYIISLVVLVIFSKNSAAPKAEGIPYEQGMR